MEKKFEHSIIETCKICKKEIRTDEDMWCSLIDYNGALQTGIGFYHQQCLKDLIEGKVKVIKDRWKEQANKMVKGIMTNLGGVQPEV